MNEVPSNDPAAPPALTNAGRTIILVCAFLGWFFCGFHMSVTSVAMRPAAIHLLEQTGELDRPRYEELAAKNKAKTISEQEESEYKVLDSTVIRTFSFLQCAFLFGAASGGLVFGRLGDRIGRAKAMSASIVMYSGMAAAASLSQSPLQLTVLWFLACTGVGGMWPNGVALLSEAWSNLSRPLVAGLIGTSANIGIFLMATLAATKGYTVTPDAWRWYVQIAAAPIVLGIISLVIVPESPRWLASREATPTALAPAVSTWDVFRGSLLPVTLLAIVLSTVPIIGGWGSANWMVPWADKVGPPELKAQVQQFRSLPGIVGSLIGGWVGYHLGRRRAYFCVSLIALGIAQYTFWNVQPGDRAFLPLVGGLGFFSGIYFGWMPLFLPELFPTRLRSTGAGVSFNFGRILTAVTVFGAGALTQFFKSDYAHIGRVTSLIFAVGMVAILFAPDTSEKQLED